MHWIFQTSSRTQTTNMVIALHQGFSTLCLGKQYIVIFIKNLCPTLVHFEKVNEEETAAKRKGGKRGGKIM